MGKAVFPIGKGRPNSFQTAWRSNGRLSSPIRLALPPNPSTGYGRFGKILGNSTIDRLLRFGERRQKSAVKDKKAV